MHLPKANKWKFPYLLLFVTSLLLSGCGTPFDYGIPSVKSDDRTTFASISATASSFKQQYTARSSELANSSQVFDLLTIAGGIATVYAIIFRGSVREVEALSAGTATSYAVGSYYATRVRATTYLNGGAAMGCVATLSTTANSLFTSGDQQKIMDVYKISTDQNRSTLQPLVDFPANGPMLLSSAIDSINAKILSTEITASPVPDISTLQTTMFSQIQDAVTKQQAFSNAASHPMTRKEFFTTYDSAPPAVTIDDIRAQIDFVANFSPAVTACIAKAG